MLDDIFAEELRRYRITIYERGSMVHAAFLTPYPWGAHRLSVRSDLHGPDKLEAAGMQIARIALGHDFQRSGYREEYFNRKDWAEARRWLGRRLMSDRLMSKASRLEWEPWQLAEEVGVSEDLAWYRWKDWKQCRGEIVYLSLPGPRDLFPPVEIQDF